MEKFSSILEVWPEGGSEQKFLSVALSSMNGDPTFPRTDDDLSFAAGHMANEIKQT
jgi:hypothetical protein